MENNQQYQSTEEEIKALKKDKFSDRILQIGFYLASASSILNGSYYAANGTLILYDLIDPTLNGAENEPSPLLIGGYILGSIVCGGLGYLKGRKVKKTANKISELEKKLENKQD